MVTSRKQKVFDYDNGPVPFVEDWRQIVGQRAGVNQGHEGRTGPSQTLFFSPYALTDGISIISEDY